MPVVFVIASRKATTWFELAHHAFNDIALPGPLPVTASLHLAVGVGFMAITVTAASHKATRSPADVIRPSARRRTTACIQKYLFLRGDTHQ
jgi:hypothetical protein